MDDLISRKALIEHCKEIVANDWNKKAAPISWSFAYEQFIEDLEEAASVDAVEVVRCKDCKFMDDRKESWFCDVWGYYGAPIQNAYCSYGERKEKGE